MSVWFQGVFCLSWPNVRLSFAGHAVGTLQILQATSALRQSQRETYTSTGVVFCESVRQALGTELKYFCVLRAMCLELLMSHKPLEACHHHLRIDFIDWMQYSTLIRVLYFVFVFRFCRNVYSNIIHCASRKSECRRDTYPEREKLQPMFKDIRSHREVSLYRRLGHPCEQSGPLEPQYCTSAFLLQFPPAHPTKSNLLHKF